MMPTPTSLRSRLARIVAFVSALAVIVCATFIALMVINDHAALGIKSAMDRVRNAEEAELTLLLDATSQDVVVQTRLEDELRRKVVAARRHAGLDLEPGLIEDAERRVTEYLATPRADRSGRHVAAYEALQALVLANLEHADRTKHRIDQWDRRGKVLAILVMGLLFTITAWFAWWVKHRAFKTAFVLADAMRRYTHGDQQTHDQEASYEELDLVRSRFNELVHASSIQRAGQLAFLGGIAHDLRGPLGALKLALPVMFLREPSKVSKVSEIARRQLCALERMIEDFLDTARLDSGELGLRIADENMCEVIDDIVEQYAVQAPHHRIVVTHPPEAMIVPCDRVRIEQVLSNLMNNAVKYSPDGGVVRVSLGTIGTAAMIVISDTGIGISDDDQLKLFEPFNRVGTMKHRIAGVGLGLFVVRRILRAHGGSIVVASRVGKGTTFTIQLPGSSTEPQVNGDSPPARESPRAIGTLSG
jgi:signal transduction histidine kinase